MVSFAQDAYAFGNQSVTVAAHSFGLDYQHYKMSVQLPLADLSSLLVPTLLAAMVQPLEAFGTL